MRVHVPPTDQWVDDATYETIVAIAEVAERDIRSLLPALRDDLYLFVHRTDQVIAETGEGGYAIGPHCIRWDVDPSRGIAEVAQAHLRATLFHECHHTVRLQLFPEEELPGSWLEVAVFEGLASVFEDLAGGPRPAWRHYDPRVIRSWADELLIQPVDDTWWQWKFQHPDGRRNIAYRVGCWLADCAIERSGRSSADLVWEAPTVVAELAGYDVPTSPL